MALVCSTDARVTRGPAPPAEHSSRTDMEDDLRPLPAHVAHHAPGVRHFERASLPAQVLMTLVLWPRDGSLLLVELTRSAALASCTGQPDRCQPTERGRRRSGARTGAATVTDQRCLPARGAPAAHGTACSCAVHGVQWLLLSSAAACAETKVAKRVLEETLLKVCRWCEAQHVHHDNAAPLTWPRVS